MPQTPNGLEDIADTAKGVRLTMHVPYLLHDRETREEIKRTIYSASTLKELFEQVLEGLKPKLEPGRYTRLENYLFDAVDRSQLGKSLFVSVNNELIRPPDGNKPLKAGDYVMVVGQMSGG